MTLLISIFASVIVTVIWYVKPNLNMKLTTLVFMFWGASIMWLVDAIFEYSELGATYFTPKPIDMLNDTFLGLSVIGVALVIWIVIVLISDPKGTVKTALFKKQ